MILPACGACREPETGCRKLYLDAKALDFCPTCHDALIRIFKSGVSVDAYVGDVDIRAVAATHTRRILSDAARAKRETAEFIRANQPLAYKPSEIR